MLTDTQCRAASPRDKAYKLPDGSGQVLEVKPNGVKAWRYRFKLNVQGETRESMFAIGDYAVAPRGETVEQAKARRDGGRFTLAEARDERTRARDLVKQGVNPAHDGQLARLRRDHDGATTFESVAHEWLAMKDWESVTKKRRLDMLQRVVFGKIGPLAKAAKSARNEEVGQRHALARHSAARIWAASRPAPPNHRYLARKGVEPHGLRVYKGVLVVPVRDLAGQLHSLQFISAGGVKPYLKGGRIQGLCSCIGEPPDPIGDAPLTICLAEGFATGASLHQASGPSGYHLSCWKPCSRRIGTEGTLPRISHHRVCQ